MGAGAGSAVLFVLESTEASVGCFEVSSGRIVLEASVMKDVVVIIGGPPPEEGEDMFGKALKEAIGRVLGVEPTEIREAGSGIINHEERSGFGNFLREVINSQERAFIRDIVEGLTKENGDLRKMCDDYRSAIEKLRAKVVEQDKVIEKLAMANSSPGKSSMSC